MLRVVDGLLGTLTGETVKATPIRIPIAGNTIYDTQFDEAMLNATTPSVSRIFATPKCAHEKSKTL